MIVQINERFQLAKFVSGGTIAAIQKSDVGGVRLGGERREVAILFADIRGYTAFAEPRDPETVVEVLNYYFQRLADLVAAHHGDIDKYVGDQIMAVFHGENMAADSTACCLAIQDVMDELKAEHPEWGLDIGIGVDMGEVVMGAMGSKERMDYTVLGDHVNLAARLCSYAAARQIHRLTGGGRQDQGQSGLPARGPGADQGQGQERGAQCLFGDKGDGDEATGSDARSSDGKGSVNGLVQAPEEGADGMLQSDSARSTGRGHRGRRPCCGARRAAVAGMGCRRRRPTGPQAHRPVL